MRIQVTEPITVLKKACKQLGIPGKLTKEIVEQFEVGYLPGQSVTAYDLCGEIFCIPNLVSTSKQQKDLEEKVGKAINLNYEKLAEDDE